MKLPSPLVQWMIDTRPLWPVNSASTPQQQMTEFCKVAARPLLLLTKEERRNVLKFYRVEDAKLSLASCLLKHVMVTRICGVPWAESAITRDPSGKPCFIGKDGKKKIDFNVSHQAGIVSAIASATDCGTDVTCTNERKNVTLEKSGFFAWVELHADMFCPSEVQALMYDPIHLNLDLEFSGYGRDAVSRCQFLGRKVTWFMDGKSYHLDSSEIIDAKLRRFYALWCLREAYVKMTGEALLAPWLHDLEFRNVRAPVPSKDSIEGDLLPGEVITEFEIYLKGVQVTDVAMELRAYGQHYMVASAIRTDTSGKKVLFAPYMELDLQRDVYNIGEKKPGSTVEYNYVPRA